MFGKNTWDTVKAFFDSMKVPIFLLAFLLLYSYPQKIKEFIDRAGFRVEEINVAGVKLAEKVEEAAVNLKGSEQELEQVAAAFAQRGELLRQIAEETSDEGIKARVQAALAEGDAITTSALAAASQASITAAEITESLQAPAQATPATPPEPAPAVGTGGYLIVFGADLDIGSALHEIGRVKSAAPADAGSFALFKKGSFYRSAAVFKDAPARDAAVNALSAAAGRSVEAVTLERWCPGAAPMPDADADVPVYQC